MLLFEQQLFKEDVVAGSELALESRSAAWIVAFFKVKLGDCTTLVALCPRASIRSVSNTRLSFS